MEDVGLFYGHLVYIFFGQLVHFMVICKKNPVLVCCTKKNLATLVVGSRTLKFVFAIFRANFSSLASSPCAGNNSVSDVLEPKL
jgi:hypothetical protein